MNYYNEIDPKAAAWLRELIKQNLIPDGLVDTRSITEIKPNELKQYTQCHFFAGIGGWSLALQLAGWPATRPVWTGSCPCQPFSSAGKQLGDKDERHLWPIFFDLIRQCRPDTVFGEQVANAIGKGWLDGVSSDLEGAGYACGAAVIGAHSVGSPHIRQRLFWVANAAGGQREQCLRSCGDDVQRSADDGATGGLADAECLRCDTGLTGDGRGQEGAGSKYGEVADRRSGLANAIGSGVGWRDQRGIGAGGEQVAQQKDGAHTANQSGNGSEDAGAATGGLAHAIGERGCSRSARIKDAVNVGQSMQTSRFQRLGFWSEFDIIPCRDRKARRVEPGTFPLAYGVSGRVGLLRGYGNAIVPPLAAQFIYACEKAKQDLELL